MVPMRGSSRACFIEPSHEDLQRNVLLVAIRAVGASNYQTTTQINNPRTYWTTIEPKYGRTVRITMQQDLANNTFGDNRVILISP